MFFLFKRSADKESKIGIRITKGVQIGEKTMFLSMLYKNHLWSLPQGKCGKTQGSFQHMRENSVEIHINRRFAGEMRCGKVEKPVENRRGIPQAYIRQKP